MPFLIQISFFLLAIMGCAFRTFAAPVERRGDFLIQKIERPSLARDCREELELAGTPQLVQEHTSTSQWVEALRETDADRIDALLSDQELFGAIPNPLKPLLRALQDSLGDEAERAWLLTLLPRVIRSYPASMEARDADYNTPLHLAILLNQFEAIELLIHRGADLSARNSHDHTPFDVALFKQNVLALVSLWKSTLGGEEERDEQGDLTPLRNVESLPSQLLKRERLPLLSYVVKHWDRPRKRGEGRAPRPHLEELIQAHIPGFYNFAAVDSHGDNALHLAVRLQDFDAVQLLTDPGIAFPLRAKLKRAKNQHQLTPALFALGMYEQFVKTSSAKHAAMSADDGTLKALSIFSVLKHSYN